MPMQLNKVSYNQEDLNTFQRRLGELESRITNRLAPQAINVNEINNKLKQHSVSIQKANYFNGFISEWKKNVDKELVTMKQSVASADNIKKEFVRQWNYVQEKLLALQNTQIDLNLLKETFYKENSKAKNTEMDFARNVEEVRSTFNKQNIEFERMWNEQTAVIQTAIQDLLDIRKSVEEQKTKYAGNVQFRRVKV